MNQVGEDPEWGVMSLLLPVSTATDSAEKGLHWCAFILRGSLGAGVPERELSWSGVSVEHPHVPRGKQVDEVQALEETFLRIQDPSSLFRNVHQPSRQKRKHCHEGILRETLETDTEELTNTPLRSQFLLCLYHSMRHTPRPQHARTHPL